MAIPEFLDQDRFYLDLENDKIEWMYHNPDSVSGGQFVTNVFDLDLLEEAMERMVDPEDAFDYIGSCCRQYLSDRGTDFFGEAWKRMETEEPFAIGCGLTTLENIRLAYLAKQHINEYCQQEFESHADFSDMRRVGIGYTTITDEEHEVQAYANLIDHRIEVYLNGSLAKYQQHSSLLDMVHFGLPNLDFSDLIDIPDWVVSNHERTAQLEDLAIRLTFFMKDHDPYGYADVMEVGETDADMVAKMRAELNDTSLIPPTIAEMETIIKEGNLSGADKAKCYDMMTDLYHLYAEEMFVPVYDRETDILYTALDALGLEGYELSFDSEGICMSKDGEEWHNDDIYRYLANTISVDSCRAFRDKSFMDYTDFSDLALHYDVRIGTKLRTPPVARLDFLGSNGAVGDSVEYQTEADFLKALKEELDHGVPLVIVLYRDSDGKTISRGFLEDLDTMPKGLKEEDAPVMQPFKKPAERSDAR